MGTYQKITPTIIKQVRATRLSHFFNFLPIFIKAHPTC